MTKILAISGGIDSMVMLDIMRKSSDSGDALVVAHFDHGTRSSSVDDANFVHQKAMSTKLPFVLGLGELGENVAEEIAREARYNFLRKASSENGCAEIYTAHHLDDLIESIAINILRGTGWRGLAVLDTPGIRRPFLEPELLQRNTPMDKTSIYQYAANHVIIFRQDPTNNEDSYLRNRVRQKLQGFQYKKEIYELWQEQKNIKREIDNIIQELLPPKGTIWQRSWFRGLDKRVALELLRAGTLRAGISATRPQLEDFRQAILTYASGKKFNLPKDHLVKFKKETFVL